MRELISYHSYIDELLLQSGHGDVFFDEKILAEPIKLTPFEMAHRRASYEVISRFFAIAREIFKRCVFSKTDSLLKELLINDSAHQLPKNFYQMLPKAVWTEPVFFRTDESRAGKIFEIQCPGSGWGDLLLLGSLYKDRLEDSGLNSFDPRLAIIKAIQTICDTEYPAVLHLLDNSSSPSSMQYLIRTTQPPLRYWGYSKDVRSGDCAFIRSHSVYGLIAENLFRHRLELAESGKLKFDLPPLLIFDQKMILCLPFLDETREEFSDEIRDLLAYTYPVSPDGFRDVNGEWVTVNAFLQRQPHLRKYFLKYGGCDTTVNWGSRAVYRLDSESASDHLARAVDDYQNGRPWVIQPALADKETVTYFSRDSAESRTEKLTSKYSTFYGPDGPLGVRSHHRQNTKVHGQSDTIVGLAI